MVQKVIKVGDSLGVTIPKEKAREMKLKAGDRVDIFVRPASQLVPDQEIIQAAKSILSRYKQDFVNLAKK